MAKTKAPEVNTEEITEATPAPDLWEQKIAIKIPKTRDTKEDVTVSINDRTFLIQRGVTVEVPLPVYYVLRNQERAQEARDAYIEENASD